MPSFRKLFDNFAEIQEPTLCDVEGDVPKWLKGTLLRNGPGKFSIGKSEFNHLFDGSAYLQRYHFDDGKVHYNAKFLRSNAYENNIKADKIVSNEFGTVGLKDPAQSIFRKWVSYFSLRAPSDNALVNILQCGDNIYATTETPLMHELNIESLKNIKKVNMHEVVSVDSLTAHQHYDEHGNIYNIGTQFGRKSKYIFFKTPNPKMDKTNQGSNPDFSSTTVLGQIEASGSQGPAYYHSFAMTSNFFILFESSLRINALSLLTASFTNKSYRDALRYTPGQKVTIVRLVKRETGKEWSVKIQSPCFFTFHHANAYEHDNHIFIDYSRYGNVGNVEFLTMNSMRTGGFVNVDDSQRGYLHRMIIPLEIPSDCAPGTDLLQGKTFAGNCRFIAQSDGSFLAVDDRLCDTALEFPRYNYDAFNMKPYRFVYGSVLQPIKNSLHGLIKVDVDAKTSKMWDRDNEEQMCTEPVFVPSPGATNEDDGVLLCPVLTVEEGARPFLLVLNAADMSELARCYINYRLPLSFHGHFVHPFN